MHQALSNIIFQITPIVYDAASVFETLNSCIMWIIGVCFLFVVLRLLRRKPKKKGGAK